MNQRPAVSRRAWSFEQFERAVVAPAQERGEFVLLHGAGGFEEHGGEPGEGRQ